MLDDEVVPALFQRLDQAFPEFGWKRKNARTWEASDDAFTHGRFGARADRVFCKDDKPWLIGCAGGAGMSWIEYVAGEAPRGAAFVAAVKQLAGLAGVVVPDGDLSEADKAAIEERQENARLEAERRRDAAEAEQDLEDEAAMAAAIELWEGSRDHDNESAARAMAGYFGRERKINLEAVGAWPWSIRFGRMYPDGTGSAILCAAMRGSEVVGLQRIAVSADGTPVRGKDRAKIKKMIGRPKGGAVPIEGTERLDTLVICEGIETGLAISAATGMNVACCLSAGFLAAYEPPEQFETVVIAGDLDQSNAGQAWAIKVEEQLHKAGRKAAIALPSHEVAERLVTSAGRPRGKSVDWLDVYQAGGPDVVAGAMCQAADGAGTGGSGDGDQDWDGKRIMPKNDLHRARYYLLDCACPPKGKRGCRGIYLVSLGGLFYAYKGSGWRDLGRGIEAVRREVRRWADEDWWELRVRRVKGHDMLDPKRLCMAKTAVEAVVQAINDEAMVHLDEGAATRFWLRPMFDAAGRVDWSQRAFERIDTGDDNPKPEQVIALKNGLLDVSAWKTGKTRLMPHSELFFNTTELPWKMPELSAKVSDEELEEHIDDLCPEWLDFLARKLRSDEDQGQGVRELQKYFGYMLTVDISHQFGNLGVWVGPPGTGKSTAKTVLCELIGSRNVISSRLDLLSNGPHMAAWMDKLAAIFPDAGVANRADKELAVEVIKAITGGDPLSLRKLYQDELPNQQLSTRLLMLVNEMPDLPDRSGSLKRRMVVWDWSVRHDEEDHEIVARLLEPGAMSGVLLWALLGLRRLEQDGGFVQPEAGRLALEVFNDSASELAEFVEEWLEVTDDEDAFEACSSLYLSFCHYWKHERQRSRDPIGDTRFFRETLSLLQGKGWRGSRDKRRGARGYTGVRIKAAMVDSLDGWSSS